MFGARLVAGSLGGIQYSSSQRLSEANIKSQVEAQKEFNKYVTECTEERRDYDNMKDVTPKNEPTEILALDNIAPTVKTKIIHSTNILK